MKNLDTSLLDTSQLLDESFSNFGVRDLYANKSINTSSARGAINPNDEDILILKNEIKNIQISTAPSIESLNEIKGLITKLKIELSTIIFNINNNNFDIPSVQLMGKTSVFKRRDTLNILIPNLENKVKSLQDDIDSKYELIKSKQEKINSLSVISKGELVGMISSSNDNSVSDLGSYTMLPNKNIVELDNSVKNNIPRNGNSGASSESINSAVNSGAGLKQSIKSVFTTKNIIIGTVILGLVGFGIYKSGIAKGLLKF